MSVDLKSAPPAPTVLELLGLNELVQIDRWALERRARALAQPVYLGHSVALCRALGRYKMFIDTNDIGFGAHMLLDGFWESWLTVFMSRRLAPGMAVADVGANHGYYTLLMADIVGAGGRVAAVEPNPTISRLLKRTVEVNGFAGRVSLFEAAAGAEDGGSVWLSLPENEPKNAHVVAAPPDSEGPHPSIVQVPSARLATLLAGWERVDFLKIDVEGAEEAAIAGLEPIIERDRPQIVLEFNRHRCAEPEALITRLRALYGVISWVDFEGEIQPLEDAEILDESRQEDWLLFLAPP